jgi:type IV pilus assembly protein PilW
MATRRHHNIRDAGFSLVELMVAMLVGTLLTLSVTTLLAEAEGRRRTLQSVDDMVQIGNYALYQVDRFIRSAGSGFASSYALSYGCKLDAVKSGTTLLPVPASALPAPFSGFPANINGAFRLTPALIVNNGSGFTNGSSDALILMSGASGYGEVPTTFTQAPTSTTLTLTGTLGFNNIYNTSVGDLLLLADQNSGAGIAPCLIEQVDLAGFSPSSTTSQVPLAGSYYTASGADVVLNSFSASGEAMNLGNPAGGNPPLFQILAVKEGSTSTNYALYSYDLLNISNPGVASVVADEVFEMHALYDVDTDGDSLPDAWVSADPASSSSIVKSVAYDAASLMTGTTAAAVALHNIKAIRIGLIIRSPLKEKDTIQAATTLSLFRDLTDINGAALTYTRTLAGAEINYRYRTLESTVPIRNSFFY